MVSLQYIKMISDQEVANSTILCNLIKWFNLF